MEPEISDATLAEIHTAEQRLLLRRLLVRAAVALLPFALWAIADRHFGSPLFMIAGLVMLPALGAGWEWGRHRNRGPGAITMTRAERVQARDDQVAILERVTSRGSYGTYALIGLILVVAAAQLFLAGSVQRSMEAAGLVKAAARSGQWWRLVSATYLHLSPPHIYGNLGALFILGRLVEGYAPRWRLPLIYALAGVCGSVASLFLIAKSSAGASGAIMGLAGYLAAISYLDPNALPKSARMRVLTMVGGTAYLGAFGFAFIDNAAHAGGFLAGAFIAWWSWKRGVEDEQLLNALGVLAAVCLLIGAGGTVYAIDHRGYIVAPVMRSVSSVSATLTGTSSTLSATVKNDSDKTLEAYRLEVVSDRVTVETAWRDDCCFAAVSSAKPVAAHSFAVLPLSVLEVRLRFGPPRARITLAVFSDGSYEGRASEYDLMMAQRQWVADDADYWLQAIAEDRSKPDREWRRSMQARMELRAHASTFGRPSASALGIPKLVSVIGNSPANFERNVDAQVAAIAAVRDELRARLRRR